MKIIINESNAEFLKQKEIENEKKEIEKLPINVKLIDGKLVDKNGKLIDFNSKVSSINSINLDKKNQITKIFNNTNNNLEKNTIDFKNSEFYDKTLNNYRKLNPISNAFINNEINLNVEWWDIPYLKDKNNINYYKDDNLNLVEILPSIDNQQTNNLFKQNIETNNKELPDILTKSEQKKIKMIKKKKINDEIQEKIKYGIIPPKQPKVKMSNYLNSLQTEVIINPTEVEHNVKKSVENRLEIHNIKNEKRKNNKENKNIKNERKQEKDLKENPSMIVFQFPNLYKNAKNLIIKNINYWKFQGLFLLSQNFENINSLLILKSGAKNLKFIKKLILNRLKITPTPEIKFEGDFDIHLNNFKIIKIFEKENLISLLEDNSLGGLTKTIFK